MNIEKMREEFEAWVNFRALDTPMGFYPRLLHRSRLDEDIYTTSWVDSAWEGWQASRAALLIELPVKGNPRPENEVSWHNIRNQTIEACARSIEAAGVKVKP